MASQSNKAKRPRSSGKGGADARRKGRKGAAGVSSAAGAASGKTGAGATGGRATPSTDAAKAQREGAGFNAALVAVALFCVLVVFQGGFYAGAVCAIAAVGTAGFVVAAMVRKDLRACSWPSALLLVLAFLYLASALLHGAGATMLQEAATWFAIAGLSLWCYPATRAHKQQALRALRDAGVVAAVAGIAMFAGILPVQGTVNAGRLMFTFQYANTAGLFFAVVAVLCLADESVPRKAVAAVPVIALLMTQSVGAILVFVAGVAALGAKMVRDGELGRVPFAVACAGVIVAVAAVAVAAGGRIAQASQTFVERIVQMLDALGVLAANLAFGIGPDQWQFAYPAVQSAQYRAADVHCSYLQAAVDAGLLALVAIVLLVALCVARLAARRDFVALVCTCMVGVHALFDFDLQFAAIVLLLVLLAAETRDELADERVGRAEGRGAVAADGRADALQSLAAAIAERGKVLCWATAACALVASCAGVALDMQMGQVQEVASREAGEAAAQVLARPYLAGDAAMQSAAVNALFAAGEDDALIDFVERTGASIPATDLRCALSLHRVGRDAEALEAFAAVLEAYPFDVDLYDAARQGVEEEGLGESFAAAYDAAARRANELLDVGHAAWLVGQQRMETLEGA